MYGNGFNLSAPRYLEPGRPFHLDAEHPRSSRLEYGGQNPQVYCAPYFASGAKAAQSTTPSVRIQDTRQVACVMKSHPSMQEAFHSTGAAETFSAPRPGQHQNGGRDFERDFQAKDYSPTSSVVFDGNMPAVYGDRAQDKPSVQHDDKPRAEGSHGIEDGPTVRPCAEKKMAATKGSAGCEYAGCNRTPQYGTTEGLLSFCQHHKRKGMYIVRNGVLLVATRDGSAFRQAGAGSAITTDNAATATESSQAPHDTARQLEAPAPAPSHGLDQDAHARPRKSLEVTPRKKCEIPDCHVQPSYGNAGTTRPRFCSRHKEKGQVCVKNRPCLFQGCDTRPHYGYPDGRGVFCVAHKKEGMIHLLNETNSAKKEEATRKRREARAAEEVECRSAGNPTDEEDEEGGREERHEKRQNGQSSARGGGSSSAGNLHVAGKRGNNADKRRKTAAGTFSPTKGSSSPNRKADGSGLAPSDEMKLLLEARESTRAAGEAGNSGRRPRAPSRKFLEASGKVLDEGAQWMTKEKREEQVRKQRELKEQKKAAAAAGLKVGQVLEAAALRANRSGGAWGGGGRVVSKVVWRKLTPAEILRVAGNQPATDGAQLDIAKAADTTGVVAVGQSKQGESASTPAAAASQADTMPEAKAKHVAEAGGPATQQGSTVVEMAHESRPKQSRKDRDDGAGEGETRAAKATCEFENCPKKASFGVNGVVRYCKMHRIFGMQKIDGRT